MPETTQVHPDPDACPQCGEVPQACSFCATTARHFLNAEVLVSVLDRYTLEGDVDERQEGTIYFCDTHKESILSDTVKEGNDPNVELGMYCPTDGCACDTW